MYARKACQSKRGSVCAVTVLMCHCVCWTNLLQWERTPCSWEKTRWCSQGNLKIKRTRKFKTAPQTEFMCCLEPLLTALALDAPCHKWSYCNNILKMYRVTSQHCEGKDGMFILCINEQNMPELRVRLCQEKLFLTEQPAVFTVRGRTRTH